MEQDDMLQLVEIVNVIRDHCENTLCRECYFTELCDVAEDNGLGTLDTYFTNKAVKSATS